MKLSFFRNALFLCLLILTTSQYCRAQGDLKIYICNKGTVPVYVAMASVGGLLNKISIKGWYKIEPQSNWMCPMFYWGTTRRTYYFSFAITVDKGRYGIVNYQPSRDDDGHSQQQFYLAVPTSGAIAKEDYRNALQQPGLGETLIPFTWSVAKSGDYDRDYSMSIHLKPSSLDPILMYLSGGETAPKTSKSKEEIEKEELSRIDRGRLLGWIKIFPTPAGLDAALKDNWAECVTDEILSSKKLTLDQKKGLAFWGRMSTTYKEAGVEKILDEISASCKFLVERWHKNSQ